MRESFFVHVCGIEMSIFVIICENTKEYPSAEYYLMRL